MIRGILTVLVLLAILGGVAVMLEIVSPDESGGKNDGPAGSEAETEIEDMYPEKHQTVITAMDAVDRMDRYRWHKYPEELPAEEKQYLICDVVLGEPYFGVASWANNLFDVDFFSSSKKTGQAGFYNDDSYYGPYTEEPEYWKEIDWSDIR